MRYVINFGSIFDQSVIITTEGYTQLDRRIIYQICVQLCDFVGVWSEARLGEDNHLAGKLFVIDSDEVEIRENVRLIDFLNDLGYLSVKDQVTKLEKDILKMYEDEEEI